MLALVIRHLSYVSLVICMIAASCLHAHEIAKHSVDPLKSLAQYDRPS